MTSLTVWDSHGEPPRDKGAVALWGRYRPEGSGAACFSLPELVKADQLRLRRDYLAWVHDLGRRGVRGRIVQDRMMIRRNLSYWWMTVPAEFAITADSAPYTAVRLVALARLVEQVGATRIDVVSGDEALNRIITGWARSLGLSVTSRPLPSIDGPATSRWRDFRESVYRAIPPLAALRELIPHTVVALRPAPDGYRPTAQSRLCIVDYLAHLGPDAEREGPFSSRYWGPLVDLLAESGEPNTWLHISAEVARPAAIRREAELVNRFNSTGDGRPHVLLHGRMTIGTLLRACRDYARVVRYGLSTGRKTTFFMDEASGATLWDAFRPQYRDEYYGRTAMLNCLWINLFAAALTSIPRQEQGFYLMENQPWEAAFIRAWRAAGHGELVGVIHSTALFWSTRLFKDPRDMWGDDAGDLPWPDLVAVNGPAMRTACLTAGYPPERLVDVEALRYLDLLRPTIETPHGATKRILVLGEYAPELDEAMVSLMSAALDRLPSSHVVVYRQHPAFEGRAVPLDPRFTIDPAASIGEAVDSVDVVVAGPMSSAAVEAVARGRSVLLMGDPRTFATSPVDGMSGVTWFASASSLAAGLTAVDTAPTPSAPGSFFWLDPSLRRWLRLVQGRARSRQE